VTLGERFDLRDEAQNPANHLGKIVRIRPDGSVPDDNPFVGEKGKRPEIWSLGHRNVQAAALHPETGELWTVEHGARGGDEINLVRKGRNYGWPVISYGVHYSGQKIGEGSAKAGMEQPVYYWDPSIAPSGMAFYTGDKFPGWRGSLLVGALAAQLVARLELSGGRAAREERMLRQVGERIRDVRQGPDGFVYLLTDAERGRILRLRPADGRS
jgi:aldose sugar dehydrogenase